MTSKTLNCCVQFIIHKKNCIKMPGFMPILAACSWYWQPMGPKVYVPSSKLGLSHPLYRLRVCPSPRYQRGMGLGILACGWVVEGVPIPTTDIALTTSQSCCLHGTPTKRQVSKRQVSKRLVSKRPVSKRQVYKTSGLQNVRFQNIWFQNIRFLNLIYLLTLS